MNASRDNIGLGFFPLAPEAFRAFAKVNATSEEIGPIATYLDEGVGASKHHEHDSILKTEIVLLGLYGCDTLSAAICCLVTTSRDKTDGVDVTHAIKLDSIVVDQHSRRRGLGVALVSECFAEIIEDPGKNVRHLYAHSVHPATVRLLRTLAFQDPPPSGAPISSLHLEDGAGALVKRCNDRLASVSTSLKLHCSYCQSNSRKARRWCSKVRFDA